MEAHSSKTGLVSGVIRKPGTALLQDLRAKLLKEFENKSIEHIKDNEAVVISRLVSSVKSQMSYGMRGTKSYNDASTEERKQQFNLVGDILRSYVDDLVHSIATEMGKQRK